MAALDQVRKWLFSVVHLIAGGIKLVLVQNLGRRFAFPLMPP